MKSRLLMIMALILAVATVAATATAFAEPKKKQFDTGQIADSVHMTSQAILRLKVRALRNTNPPQTVPVTVRVGKPN